MVSSLLCNRFTLETHAGEYENWPEKSRLIVDGTLTGIRVPGYTLLHQFKIADGYLLVTDYDCPFEEATDFILLSPALQVLSARSFGAPYASFSLETIEWLDERNLIAMFYGDDRWKISIARWGIPFLRPRISAKRIE